MKIVTMAGLAVLLLSRCQAADEIKPLDVKLGLWETTSKMDINGMPAMPAMPQIPEETLAKLPPAQRAQIEARMKAAGGPRTTTVKSCITRDSLNRGVFGPTENSCTYKVANSSSSKLEVHMECNREKTTMTGDLVVERADSEHAKGTMVMKASEGSMPINMKMTFDTKWLSSDCGDVKPMAPVAK